MKNKRAVSSIAVVLLVFATLVLTIFALFTFYTKQSSFQEKIYVTGFVEGIYAKEEQINFYVDNIMEKAVEASAASKDAESFEEDFKNNFTTKLNKYKAQDGSFVVKELEQVERQVNENNEIFVIEDTIENGKTIKKIEAEFTIVLNDKVEKDGKELFSASYEYRKKFEKAL